ncbi:MAG: aldehyde dehydrogenase family protein [Proteobacteria bacterium]|nr:aldehyde dehydrogenase family protein [Pseudomonadota bacterium]
MLIGGEWVDAPGKYAVTSPATGELVATAAKGTAAHAEAAIQAARQSYEKGEWRNLPAEKRADLLEEISEQMSLQLDELSDLQCRENGATIRQALAFHIGYSISHLRYFADLTRTFPFEESGPLLRYPTLACGTTRREPIGVCGAIVPWNFPLLLALWKIAPALAAGNSIVVKPDEKTPLTLLAFARIARECGLPDGVLNVVTGDGPDVGGALAGHPDVRKIAFTGSTAVGRIIQRQAASNVKRVTLELGGKGPNIVLADADTDIAVDGALFAFLLYSGQACESGTRLLLPSGIHDEFLERLVERAKTVKLGDPLDFDTDMGPVISPEQQRRILGYIASGKSEGATLRLGGGVPQGAAFENGYWVEPTIFSDVTNDMTIAREEIFGPVLCVMRYESEEEAIAIANDTEYGLSAGVWSRDIERAMEIANRLEAGTVWINDWHMVNCQYPFGGYKQSGLGRELGPDALTEYTEAKFVHVDMTGRLESHVFDVVASTPPEGD